MDLSETDDDIEEVEAEMTLGIFSPAMKAKKGLQLNFENILNQSITEGLDITLNFPGSPMPSPIRSPMGSPMNSPMNSPMACRIASPLASPIPAKSGFINNLQPQWLDVSTWNVTLFLQTCRNH